jgi:hypothetical protein
MSEAFTMMFTTSQLLLELYENISMVVTPADIRQNLKSLITAVIERP